MIVKEIPGTIQLTIYSKTGNRHEITIHRVPEDKLREIATLLGLELELFGMESGRHVYSVKIDGITLFS
jgi:hypothetical protein